MTRQGMTPSKAAANAYFEKNVLPQITAKVCQSLVPIFGPVDMTPVVTPRLREAWASLELPSLPGPRALEHVAANIADSVQESVVLDTHRQEWYLTTILRVDEVCEADRQAMYELTGRSSIRGVPPPPAPINDNEDSGARKKFMCGGGPPVKLDAHDYAAMRDSSNHCTCFFGARTPRRDAPQPRRPSGHSIARRVYFWGTVGFVFH